MNFISLLLLIIFHSSLSSASSDEYCGIQSNSERHNRIVGGENAFYGQVPWQALIIENKLGMINLQKCGGVLIGPKWVLTAAHCQAGLFGKLQIVLGGYSIDYIEANKNRSIMINVVRTVIHPRFDEDRLINDIALIELESAVEYTDDISPVCMPKRNDSFAGRDGYVSGFGQLSYRGRLPRILQIVKVPIMANTECRSMFLKAGIHRMFGPQMICAGYAEGGKDACDGDSGGPLTIKLNDDRWVLVGIVSNGIKCAEPNMPGVYTNVPHYLDWVNQIINDSKN